MKGKFGRWVLLMIGEGYSLPNAENLDVQTFSRLLDQKATSYKLIFFYSILEILRRRFFDASESIDLQEVNIEMLVHAWYPHSVFRLSFGYLDKISDKLDELDISIDKPLLKVTKNDKNILREVLSERLKPENYKISDRKDLRRYVPFRLIRSFFPETAGMKDARVNAEVARLSQILFDSRKPLYKFSEDLKSITFHPEWASYLQDNYLIVHGWISWNWLFYMQSKNPNTPAIANKIFPPPDERQSLREQTKYWKAVLNCGKEVNCIYSGQEIVESDFSLDHYLPWTFVAHNNLWNLIPAPKSVNSSKSNRIPDDVYLEKLIDIQFLGIRESRKIFRENTWQKHLECYLIDLNFKSYSEILNFDTFKNKYREQVKPLISLAESQGFESEWRYDYSV